MKTRQVRRGHEPGLFLRIVSFLLIPFQLVSPLMPALQAATPATSGATSSARPVTSVAPMVRTPDNIQVNRTVPAHAPSSQMTGLGANPTDREIAALRLFPHRLVPVDRSGGDSLLARVGRVFGGGNSSPSTATNDNRTLAAYLGAGLKSADSRDATALQGFLQANPQSRWAPSLRHELARRLFQQGYFSRAIAEWEMVWSQVKDGRDAGSLAVGDEVLSHLLEVCLGLSDTRRLTDLIGAAEARPIGNVLEAKLGRAKQSVWLLKHKGGQNIQCGPIALYGLLRHEGRSFEPIRLDTATDDYIATGLPLTELRAYGDRYQLDLVMVKRPAGAAIPVPSVMHSAGGHYSTLVERDGDAYFLVDRAMQFEGWVPRAAIDEQASGYFLVRGDSVPPGWSRVAEAEGRSVYGRDGLHGQEPNGPNSPDCNQGAGGSGGGGCCGMPSYSFNAKLAAVRIEDTPLGYTPPVGPAVYFRVAYKDLDDSKPATSPNFSNVGRVWAIDWVAWVDHVAGNLTGSSRVTTHVQGGGTEISTYKTATGKFGPNDRSFTTVTRTGVSTYTREMPDGSKEIYDTPDNPAAPNRVFLTRKLDPAGNAVTYTYDASLRLVAVTDAIGQVTTLEHNFPADPMKITKVTDPFGRTALLGYNAQGQLNRLTDMIGLTSTFTYDAAEFITSMTTPYGTTTFTKVQGSPAYNRTVTATDPLGQQERIQFIEPIDLPTTAPAVPASVNVGGVNVPFRAETARLGWRNSFYWSKQAMQQAPGDVRVARNYRWYTDTSYLVTGVLESVKEPLEDPVWFNYPNQAAGTFPYYAGQGARPVKTLRLMPDGTPQLFQTYYNVLGRITNSIDPLGRSTVFLYASNQTDLLEVRQRTGSNTYSTLLRFTYNDQHRPVLATDAAGQTTTFSYNARGQLTALANPKGETTTFAYDVNGYVQTIDEPLPGTNDTTRFTYDAFGRARTITDSDGYQVTLDYDALDRTTGVTYPDGTTEQFTFDRLDAASARDRLGRVTTYAYDALQRLTQVVDPQSRTTRFDWCHCGDVGRIIDSLGRVTSWQYDVQGRVISKERADGARVHYVYESNTGRLKRVVDERGQFTEFQYHLDNALRQVAYPNAIVPTPSVTYGYDSSFNRITEMIDGTGISTFSYAPIPGVSSLGAGKLAMVDGPLPNDTLTFQYDELGRIVGRSIGGLAGASVFDAVGRPSQFTNLLGVFDYTYDGSSERVASISLPGAQSAVFTYHGNAKERRLQQVRHQRGGSPVSQFDYDYDTEGLITSWSQQTGSSAAQSYRFGYDRVNQLTNALLTRAAVTLKTLVYAYDPAGNRTVEQTDGVSRGFTYNALNELSASSAGVATPTTYEWDGANRLAAVNRGVNRSELTYDGLGRIARMVEKQGGATVSEKRLLWCGYDLCEERDASGSIVQKRYFDQGMQVVSGAQAGNYYYTRDHLGSVRQLVDGAGAVRANYEYDPWGRRVRTSGDREADFGFTGHYYHAATGLHLALYRAYDAELGRWLSRDPFEEDGPDGPNLYAYAGNSPVSFHDPEGGFLNFVIGAASGVVSGFIISKLTGGCYSWRDALTDAALGAAGVGIASKLNKLYRISKLKSLANSRGLNTVTQKGYAQTFNGGANQLERLVIKYKPGTSPGLQPGSKVPRFEWRTDAGKYWDPFTGQTGPKGALSHIPLQPPLSPGTSAGAGAAGGAAGAGGRAGCGCD